MDDAAAVRVLENPREIADQRDRVGDRQRPVREQVGERVTLDEARR